MKKIVFSLKRIWKVPAMLPVVVCIAVMMSSCYSSRIAHGNISPAQGIVKLASTREHYLFSGLVQVSEDKKAVDYVGDRKDYVVVRRQTFTDWLLFVLTGDIYAPRTVTFYGR